MKFDSQLPATETSWVVSWSRMVVKHSKMADGRHFENRYIAIISAKNHPISIKFCTQQQILNFMNVYSAELTNSCGQKIKELLVKFTVEVAP